jgi:hypothetical protein
MIFYTYRERVSERENMILLVGLPEGIMRGRRGKENVRK